METTTPNPSLELDSTSTGISPVSSTPATADAVINPNPLIDKEVKKDVPAGEKPVGTKDRKKARARGKLRSDHDRPRHMTRARAIREHLATARDPLVAQCFEGMERIHERYSHDKLAVRKVAAEWKDVRQQAQATAEKAGRLIAFCALKVRNPDELGWNTFQEVDLAAAEAREKKLLKGFLPSELRDPSNLFETLQHLGDVLSSDPSEIPRWDPAYVEAVHQCARALEAGLAEAGRLKQAHGIAMTRLRRTRARWDLTWSVFERLVLGTFALLGRKHEVEWAFQPIRLRGSARVKAEDAPPGTE